MNREIAAKWCAELRSGKHRQGQGKLKREDGSMCCLGVLQDVVLGMSHTAEATHLSFRARDAAGMCSVSGKISSSIKCLVDMNDQDSLSFYQIADIIEANVDAL